MKRFRAEGVEGMHDRPILAVAMWPIG
ncbi:hypothetical protein [Bradyrhizobium sp. 190]